MNTLYKLLDRMENVIMDGIPIPLMPFSIVNQEKLIGLLDKIQTAIPEEVQKADQIIERQEEIQLESQRRAQLMLQEAKLQADHMLSDSELLKAVQIEADKIRQQVMAEMTTLREQTIQEAESVRRQAYEEATAIRQMTDEYAETVLKTLGKNLDEFQVIAKNAQKQLQKVRTESMQAQYPGQAIVSAGYDAKGGKTPIAPQRNLIPDSILTPASTK